MVLRDDGIFSALVNNDIYKQ